MEEVFFNWFNDGIDFKLVYFLFYFRTDLLTGFLVMAATSNPVFRFKRDYDWRVLTTGYVLIWQPTPKPDINLYQTK